MFGSNFQQQFGIVGPPWDTLDNWQGVFGPNTQSPWELPGNDISGVKPQAAGQQQEEPKLPTAPQGTVQAAGGGAPTFEGLTGTVVNPQTKPDQNRSAAAALSPGPLAAGVNSEFDRGR